MTVYMQGTRRLEEMIANARQLSYQENYSYTEGWNDNVVAEIFNLGLDRLYHSTTMIDQPGNIEEASLDTFATQTEYAIPIDIQMAIRIMDVRYIYGTQSYEFITLRQGMIQDRFSYPTNIPDTYCIRNGKIVLSPTPNQTKLKSLIINYQKRMRKLDIRRGKITALSSLNGLIFNITQANPCRVETLLPHGLITGNTVGFQNILGMTQLNGQIFTITVVTPTGFTLDNVDSTNFFPYIDGGQFFLTPIAFQMNFTVNSEKDANLQANADSILDNIDWCCIVDRFGIPVVNAIPLYGYDNTTFILTADPKYVFPAGELDSYNSAFSNGTVMYVVSGDYSSSHSELDRQCEDQLIEFAVLRLLRLQSAAEPTEYQIQAEEAVLQRLIAAYRRYRPSVMAVVWQERMRPRSFPFGRRGMY